MEYGVSWRDIQAMTAEEVSEVLGAKRALMQVFQQAQETQAFFERAMQGGNVGMGMSGIGQGGIMGDAEPVETWFDG